MTDKNLLQPKKSTDVNLSHMKYAADHPLATLFFQKHYQLSLRLFVNVFASVALLGGGGWLLDKYLNTKPVLMIIGVVLSFPLSLIVSVKIARDLMQKTKANYKPPSK